MTTYKFTVLTPECLAKTSSFGEVNRNCCRGAMWPSQFVDHDKLMVKYEVDDTGIDQDALGVYLSVAERAGLHDTFHPPLYSCASHGNLHWQVWRAATESPSLFNNGFMPMMRRLGVRTADDVSRFTPNGCKVILLCSIFAKYERRTVDTGARGFISARWTGSHSPNALPFTEERETLRGVEAGGCVLVDPARYIIACAELINQAVPYPDKSVCKHLSSAHICSNDSTAKRLVGVFSRITSSAYRKRDVDFTGWEGGDAELYTSNLLVASRYLSGNVHSGHASSARGIYERLNAN